MSDVENKANQNTENQTINPLLDNIEKLEKQENSDYISNLTNPKSKSKNFGTTIYPNRFIKFVDHHYFLIACIISFFYCVTSITAAVDIISENEAVEFILYSIYLGFLALYILFYIGMSFVYKTPKYFLSIITGFIVGVFTCGGGLLTLVTIVDIVY